MDHSSKKVAHGCSSQSRKACCTWNFLPVNISRPFPGITSACFYLSGKKVGKGISLFPERARVFRKALGLPFRL